MRRSSKMKEKEAFLGNSDPQSKNYLSRTEKRWWMGILMCGTAILYGARTLMPVCIVDVAADMGWSKTQSGMVLSSFFWGYMTTQILGGYVSDRVGGERVLLAASVLWSSVTLLTPLIIMASKYTEHALYVVVLFRILLGISQGVHFPSTLSAMSRRVANEERSLTFSLIATGANCGTLLSGSAGSYLTETFGWQKPFYAFGILGLSWAIVANYWLIRKPACSSGGGSTNGNVSSSSQNVVAPVPWMTLFSKFCFWALLVANYCANNGSYILLSWLPTFFHENFPDAKSWVFNVVPWLVIVPCNITAGWLADTLIKMGMQTTTVRKLLSTVVFCGTASFLVMINYVESYEATLFCMTLAVGCCGFYSASIAINPVDLAPQHSGAVFGVLNTTSAIPGFVGVYMAGYILETTKSWSAVFNQTAAINIFGFFVYLIFGTARRII